MENSETSAPGDEAPVPTIPCAALLLTGGASRRMGRDKASLTLRAEGGPTLAERTAALLEEVASPVIEVGPGRSGRPAVQEQPPGGGPLAATAAGWAALAEAGWWAPVLVVATDLPGLTPGLLGWLARHPADRSVIPVAGDRVQPLCARYLPADLERAAGLVAAGRRAMGDLLRVIDAVLIPEADWLGPAGGPGALADVDTPADLERLRGPE